MTLPVQTTMFETQVEDRGEYSSSCGYCRSTRKSSNSHGMWTERMSVDHYQDLLDRGWRRSGKYVYRPNPFESCCPLYTIRLPVAEFEMSKEQRRVQRKFQRFLDGHWNREPGCAPRQSLEPESLKPAVPATAPTSSLIEEAKRQKCKNDKNFETCSGGEVREQVKTAIQSAVNAFYASSSGPLPMASASCHVMPSVSVKEIPMKVKGRLKQGSVEVPAYTSNIAFLITAGKRPGMTAGRRSEGLDPALPIKENLEGGPCGAEQHVQSANSQPPTPSAREVAEALAECMEREEKLPRGASVAATGGHLNFFSSASKAQAPGSCNGKSEPQDGAGSDPKGTTPGGQSGANRQGSFQEASCDVPPGRQRKYSFSMSRSTFKKEEFELYKKYQMAVHGDTEASLSPASYRRFLVDTPLQPVPPAHDGSTPPCGFGSFHQQHRIDGKLVMVAIVDVLPACLSSKYLIWDPDFCFLSLGKLSSLKEIEWVKGAGRGCARLGYYYLGFYGHTCLKLRYKAAYSPSDLLCPLRNVWVPYKTAIPLLDRNPAAILTRPSLETPHTTPKESGVTSNDDAFAFTLPPEPTEHFAGNLGARLDKGANRAEEEKLKAMGEQVDVDMGENGLGEVVEDADDVIRGDGLREALDGKGVEGCALSREEKREREEVAERGIGVVPMFIDGMFAPFQMLVSHKLLPNGDLVSLKRQLLSYLHLVGVDLASKMAYML